MNARSGVTSARRRTTSPQRTSRLKTPTDTTALSFYVFYGLSLFLLYVIQCMSSVSGPVPFTTYLPACLQPALLRTIEGMGYCYGCGCIFVLPSG